MNDLPRPVFHFTPPAHWMNDPNGLVYFEGEYHLFYQHHPHSMVWGPMHWGHAVSADLIHWHHLPIALYPDEHGQVFSGSAVVDWHNTAGFGEQAMIAIFTYNKDHVETQNLAYSTDRGRAWTKYPGNPVLPHPANFKDIRDPKVFWHKDHWVVLLAAGDRVLFYTSPNLKEWQPSGFFGGGYGSTSGVWETPDLFQLPVTASDSRWVLTVGVGAGASAGGSGTQYFIGDFDGRTFTSHDPKETILWMDYGADFYAPQSWNDEPNGRRIMLAWMNNWLYARDIPASTWRGSLTLPRELSLVQTDTGIVLAQQPISELIKLRGASQHWRDQLITPANSLRAEIQSASFELIAEFQANSSTRQFGIKLQTGEREQTSLLYNYIEKKLYLDRANSGNHNLNEQFSQTHLVNLTPQDQAVHLQIFIDGTSIEVFVNRGAAVLTDLIFPSSQKYTVEVFADQTLTLNFLELYELNSNEGNRI